MKKIISAFLALMLALGLLGCGSDSGNAGDAPNPTAEAETSVPEATTSEAEPGKTALPEIEETAVIDNEQCAVIVTGIEEDSIWGTQLKVRLENRTSDVNLMFSLTDAAVNGVSMTALLAETVAPGKKSNSTITLLDSEPSLDELGGLTDIGLKFRVYNSDDWTADDTATAEAHIYPYGEENAVRYSRESQPGDIVLVDNDDVSVIVTGESDGGLVYGYGLKLFLVNKTGTSVMFSADNVSVNGYMLDPYFANTVGAGECAFTEMNWFKTDLDENEITDVSDIELTLKIYDADNWLSGSIFDGTVSIEP